MPVAVLVSAAQVEKTLTSRGLVKTEMRDADNVLWYSPKDGQHYTVPEHSAYSPSVLYDLLRHIFGESEQAITELVDQHVYGIENA